MQEISIESGFFKNLMEKNAQTTVYAVYDRFLETGRFGVLACQKGETVPHVFWDSDIAKWLEGTAYILARKKDEKLQKLFDTTVETLCQSQRDDGYFNSYFAVYEPQSIFQKRPEHELYNAGHFIEAGVASSVALGDNRLLTFCEKYVDYIYERFYVKKDTGFTTPGHQEIELALVKLYKHTGKEKYLVLAEFFLNERGQKREEELYSDEEESIQTQSEKPVREVQEVRGHAVRQLYLICAMIDIAVERKDDELLNTARALLNDTINKKMYVTGGVGSSHKGENFTNAYDLPNDTAYAETCATIALVLALHRLYKIDGNPVYADAIERAVYNGVLSGLSLDGDKFFYVNPLETWMEKYDNNAKLGPRAEHLYIPERVGVFWCSCCPPNLVRFIEQIPNFIYYVQENTITIAQYITSITKENGIDIQTISNFPYDGKVQIKVNSHGKRITLKLRVPSWCEVPMNNQKDGYIVYDGTFDDTLIELDFHATLKKVYPNAQIRADDGKIALSYGPLVLCAEGADNTTLCGVKIGDIRQANVQTRLGEQIEFFVDVPVSVRKADENLYSYAKPVYEQSSLRFIPYFAWGNRGKNDMKIFFAEDNV